MRCIRFAALVLLSALCATPAAAQDGYPDPPDPHHRAVSGGRPVGRAGADHRRDA